MQSSGSASCLDNRGRIQASRRWSWNPIQSDIIESLLRLFVNIFIYKSKKFYSTVLLCSRKFQICENFTVFVEMQKTANLYFSHYFFFF